MNKVLQFFKDNELKTTHVQNIRVYGWKFEYDHLIVTSLTKYLFEELNITENIAPKENTNRDGRLMPSVEYICVHDTGDTDFDHTAGFWSNVVKIQDWEMGRYEASYQYVTGNDGIYHNIPDDEIGYHAGDGTRFPYKLYDSGLTGTNENPVVTITDDGYFAIDGIKTVLLAPRAHKEKDGVVVYDRFAKTTDIVSQGVRCKLIDGKYYIGETYFSTGYGNVSNHGGNCNSIGIESCINVGSDIYLTWQRTAKLVANLLDQNHLTFDDVKQHNYFSGKNCPQSMRMNGLWPHFMDLVKFEYQILKFKQEGWDIKLVVDDSEVKENGRIVKRDYNTKRVIKYTIETILNNDKNTYEKLEFEKEI